MASKIVPVLAFLLLSGCVGDDVATSATTTTSASAGTSEGSSGASTSTGTSDGSSGGGTSGSASTSSSSSSGGSSSSSSSGSSGSESTSSASDGTTSSGGDTTSGGGMACAFEPTESFDASLVDLDKGMGCGILTFDGTVGVNMGGVWELDNCPCGNQCFVPDPWELTIDAPADLLPKLDVCAKIVLESKPGPVPNTCELVSITIWDTMKGGAPVYAGGGAPGYAVDNLAVAGTKIDTCVCEGCCDDGEIHELTFTVDGQESALAEASEGVLGGYGIHNLASHISGICDVPAAFSWVIRAL
ncbi:MAG: hypothetical protein H6710_08680 [Myxococcales bacterium]|nr:hypothetical protein [Myxococcales bacterium]MCB9704319.1 hypothetical protein [Myxococcales bacterium]